jgi:hypothetical protein
LITAFNNLPITGLTPNTKYVWKVKSVCSISPLITSEGSERAEFTTAPLKLGEVGNETMFEIYPNPVSQSATVSFSLNEASPVVLEILDINGKSLQVFANADFSAGNHELILHRELLNSGIYFLKMKTSEGAIIKKLVID